MNPAYLVSVLGSISGCTCSPHSDRPRIIAILYFIFFVVTEPESGVSCSRLRNLSMESDISPTVLDVFCGAGGFSTGFEQAGFTTLAGIDCNNDALATFHANHSADAHDINLRETSPGDVYDAIGLHPRDVDGVIGGPPCQGHSTQGDRDPEDPRNKLMHDYLDLIEYSDLKFFVMENVPDIQTTADGKFLQKVLNRVHEMGFKTASGVLSADEFGLAQTRKRFFLVGLQHGEPTLPTPRVSTPTPVWSVLSGLPLMDNLPNNNWNAQMARHSDSTVEKHQQAQIGSDPYPNSDQQVRLAPMQPSRTVVADNFHFHPRQPRYLTVREAACLQSFPLEYRFYGGATSQRRQVGNAVPPKLAEYVAREVRDEFTKVVAGQTGLTDHGFAVSD